MLWLSVRFFASEFELSFSSLTFILLLLLVFFFFFQPDLLGVGDLVEISEGPFAMKKGEISKVQDGERSSTMFWCGGG